MRARCTTLATGAAAAVGKLIVSTPLTLAPTNVPLNVPFGPALTPVVWSLLQPAKARPPAKKATAVSGMWRQVRRDSMRRSVVRGSERHSVAHPQRPVQLHGPKAIPRRPLDAAQGGDEHRRPAGWRAPLWSRT